MWAVFFSVKLWFVQFGVDVITYLILEIVNKLGKYFVKYRSGRISSNSAEVTFLSRDGSAYLHQDYWYLYTRAVEARKAFGCGSGFAKTGN